MSTSLFDLVDSVALGSKGSVAFLVSTPEVNTVNTVSSCGCWLILLHPNKAILHRMSLVSKNTCANYSMKIALNFFTDSPRTGFVGRKLVAKMMISSCKNEIFSRLQVQFLILLSWKYLSLIWWNHHFINQFFSYVIFMLKPVWDEREHALPLFYSPLVGMHSLKKWSSRPA